MKHTPGPWEWAENGYEPNKFSIGVNNKWMLSVQHNGEQLVEKQRANLALIAASPELLAAAIEVEQMIHAGEINEGTMEVLRNAIAKAGDAA